ncbi:hypothetical protein HPP92_017109 [Vanilla planifolia]|uniref:Uncharacterized protein n=1 Tax=Vanilla planifolia TaxID=51239 RepID=A0A835UP34_VANPL|nr:hypothetical protein HPP92_017109 [Vanilla planifolia]
MDQPKVTPSSPAPPSPSIDANKKPKKNRRQPPSPEEVLSFYESKCLDPRAASLMAIGDLQSLVLRSSTSPRQDRLAASEELSRKLANLNSRLIVLDMKLNTKPAFPESFAIGIASGAVLNGLPYAFRALSHAWGSVASITASRPPSS